MKIKYLRDYPLTCLVKHYDYTELVASCDVPKEWLDLEIVHTYVEYNTRVVVVR